MTTASLQLAKIAASDRFFYAAMAFASILAVFIGFAPSYYLKAYFRNAPLTPLVHVHGLVFTGWILLFFTQTVLIATNRIRLHRWLGIAGAAWALMVVLVGIATAVAFGRHNVPSGGTATLAFLATPFGDMLVFAILATTGLLCRRRREAHKRLMLLATIVLLAAAVARWPLAIVHRGPMAFFVVTDIFLLPGIMYDLVHLRRIHPAYIWGWLLLVASQPLRLVIGRTDAWLAFARVLTR